MPALEMPYTDRSGALHPNAWIEVVRLHVELGPGGFAADYQLSLYHDQQARLDGLPPFEEWPMKPFTESAINSLVIQFQPAVYEELAALPEFSGATIVA